MAEAANNPHGQDASQDVAQDAPADLWLRAPGPRAAISIALCTFNGSAFLAEQLRSIAAQTLKPAELIICDDQSTDDTAAIVAAFAHDAPFPVSFNINSARLGVTANFQHAISLCHSPLIATCDQDDIWLPWKLETMAQCFYENPSCVLAFSDMALMNQQGQLTGKNQWQQLGFTAKDVSYFNVNGSVHAFEMLLRYNVVTGMAMMFRSSLQAIARPFDPHFIHDQWLSLLASATGRVIAIDQPLVQYRQHANQKIGTASRNPVSQWRHARKHMGSDYVQKQLTMTQSLRERLDSPQIKLRNTADLLRVDEKIAHLQARIALRQKFLTRWPGAVKEFNAGRYRQFGHGWRSFAQDLFL